jgi:hypothetical protein
VQYRNQPVVYALGTKTVSTAEIVLYSKMKSAPQNTDQLALKMPPPKPVVSIKSPKKLLLFFAIGVAGAVLGYCSVRYIDHFLLPLGGPKWLKLVVIACVPMAWLAAVGFHEFGHVVGGWVTGGRFLIWVVGPFKIQRTPSGLRFGLNRSVNTAGGMAACLPEDPKAMTPGRAAVMILGGPLASALLAGVGFAFADWLGRLPGAVTTGQAVTQYLVFITAALSSLGFVATVVPSATGGFKSDGKRALDLLRGDRRSRQEQAMLALSLATIAGQRPAKYDQALVDEVLSLNDGSLFDLYAHLTVYLRAADRGEWLEAQRHLDAVLAGEDKIAPFISDIVRAEYAWLVATVAGDATVARAWLATVGKLDFDPATRLRAEAAVLLAEGRKDAALAKAKEALEALHQRSLSPVISPFAFDALVRLKRLAAA